MLFEMEPRYATQAFRILQGRHTTLSKRQSACRRFRRTLGRFAAFQLSTSFQQWAKTSRGDARAEVILRRCLGRLANRAVGRACAAWWRVVFALRAARGAPRAGLVIIVARRRDRCYHKVAPVREPADAPDAAGASQRAALRLVARGLEGRLSTQASALKRHALNAWWSRVAKRGFVEQRLRTIATRIGAARTHEPPSGPGALTVLQRRSWPSPTKPRRAFDQARSRAVDEAAAIASLRGARAPRRG